MNKYIFISILLLAVFSCSNKNEQRQDADLAADINIQLENFEARKRYQSFNPAILASIPDSDIEQAIVDYVDDCVVNGDAGQNLAMFKKLGPGFRMVYSTIILEDEVNSGGFVQFFSNAGFLAEDATAGFKLIGAGATSGICARALELFTMDRGRPGRTGDSAGNLSTNTEEELEKLDDEFYKSAEEFSKLRIAFIRNNTAQFTTR